jgi:hypothetical protein
LQDDAVSSYADEKQPSEPDVERVDTRKMADLDDGEPLPHEGEEAIADSSSSDEKDDPEAAEKLEDEEGSARQQEADEDDQEAEQERARRKAREYVPAPVLNVSRAREERAMLGDEDGAAEVSSFSVVSRA